MPYYISDKQSDCQGWATIKADTPESTPETIGCHESKQDAIDQMIALSLSEDIEPMGEYRALPDNYRPALSDDVPEGVACGNCKFYDESRVDESGEKAFCTKWSEYVDGGFYCNAYEPMQDSEPEDDDDIDEESELRQIDLSAPQFMRDNAEQGLKYHEEGLSGDGLQPETVADARKMASGEVSIDKWRKIAPWIARHMTDLDSADGEITAGVVAHLLWGSGSTKEEAQRTMDYAQNIIDRLDEELEEEARTVEPVRENRWVIKNTDDTRKQYAFTTLEVRAIDESSDDGWTVSGYAAVFDSPSEPLPWTEYVKRGAFRKTIKDGADVRLLIDHTGVPLARTKSKTLTLREDDKGLYMEARLDPANPDAVKMRSALMRGDVSQMSFAFETVKDGWNKERTVRELKEVRLHDVSIVTYPAYEETSAEMRNNQSTDTPVGTVSPISLRKAQIALARARAVR